MKSFIIKETKAQLSQLNIELDQLVELRTRELQASEQRFRTILAIFAQRPEYAVHSIFGDMWSSGICSVASE